MLAFEVLQVKRWATVGLPCYGLRVIEGLPLVKVTRLVDPAAPAHSNNSFAELCGVSTPIHSQGG